MNKMLLLLVFLSPTLFSNKELVRDESSFGIYLQNSELTPLDSATIEVNGHNATYDKDKKVYLLAKVDPGIIKVKISRPGYENFEENVYVGKDWKNVKLYLLRKDEPYYYALGNKVPYLSNPRLLLLTYDSKLEKHRVESYVDSLNLNYVPYPEYIRGKFDSIYDATHPSVRNTLVVYRRDSSLFSENNCTELKLLRQCPYTEKAGPVIAHSKSLQPVYTYSNWFFVRLAPDLTYKTHQEKKNYNLLLRCLLKLGINDTCVKNFYDNTYIITVPDQSINQGIIFIMDNVREEPFVEYVDSGRSSYTGHD